MKLNSSIENYPTWNIECPLKIKYRPPVVLSKELEKPGPLILPNCCKAAGNNYHYLIIIDHDHHDIINQYKELRCTSMWWRSSHNRDRRWASPEGRKLLARSVPQTCRSGNCKGSTFEDNQVLKFDNWIKYAFMKTQSKVSWTFLTRFLRFTF